MVGFATVLVGRGLATRELWLGWAALWIVTTTVVFLAASDRGTPPDPVAVLLTTAAIVGVPTGAAARDACGKELA